MLRQAGGQGTPRHGSRRARLGWLHTYAGRSTFAAAPGPRSAAGMLAAAARSGSSQLTLSAGWPRPFRVAAAPPPRPHDALHAFRGLTQATMAPSHPTGLHACARHHITVQRSAPATGMPSAASIWSSNQRVRIAILPSLYRRPLPSGAACRGGCAGGSSETRGCEVAVVRFRVARGSRPAAGTGTRLACARRRLLATAAEPAMASASGSATRGCSSWLSIARLAARVEAGRAVRSGGSGSGRAGRCRGGAAARQVEAHPLCTGPSARSRAGAAPGHPR